MKSNTTRSWKIGEIQGNDVVIVSENYLEVCTVWEDPSRVDAHLISAAPDMLEALKALLSSEDYSQAERMGYAAIAKALGALA